MLPSLFHECLERSDSPYINHFIQPDTIIPSPASPQSWNRYSYVVNNPINASDPSGHICVGEPEECLNNDGTKSGGFTGTGGAGSNNAGNCSGAGCQGSDGGEPNDPTNDPEEELKTNNPAVDTWPMTVSPYGSPCEKMLTASFCGNISKLLGITVLIIDLTSLGLSVTGFIMELVGTAGGPEGLAAAIAEYAATLNPIENTLGSTALAINAFNDFVITGESFIDVSKKYQGSPSVDLVLGSDTSVSVVTTLLGLSPEGLSDSIVNTGSVAYDVHRLTGGQGLVQTHIILTANGNLHLNFGFPQ